jgi:Domain of unknown function (DUF4262)
VSPQNENTRRHIEAYGCTVIQVAAENDLPPFAYSLGISETRNAPEVLVIGLKTELSHWIVNDYNRRVRAGEVFAADTHYADFLEGFDLLAAKVASRHYGEYFGAAIRYYGHSNFEVLQLIYPNTKGVWPWSQEADDWFANWQPVLRE